MTAVNLEDARASGLAPWTEVYVEYEKLVIFYDAFPVTKNHLLFVPRQNDADHIDACFKQAHSYGRWLVLNGTADGFNVGYNCGESAGQTVKYPHVHLIPRSRNDCDNPVGGVRKVVDGQGNYRSSSYKKIGEV